MSKTSCFADEILESHENDTLEADYLLRDITLANRKPNHAESVFFQQKLGWSEKQVNDQMRRMNSVLRLQAIAGTPADRQAATTEAETSADILAKEQPKLESKISELQSKLEALQRDARLSQKRCEEQTQAVQQLRTMCPQHIQQRVESKVGTIANTLRREVLDVESRISELENCLTPAKHQNQSLYLEALRRSFREAVNAHVEGRSLTYRLSPAWPTIRSEIEAELSDLQAKLPGLRASYDDAIETAEMPLNFYTSGQTES